MSGNLSGLSSPETVQRRFLDWANVLLEVWAMPRGAERVDAVLNYLHRAAPKPSRAQIHDVIQLLPTHEGTMITWEQSVELRARRKQLLDLLERRFGPLSEEAVGVVEGATGEQLTTWFERFADGVPAVDDILRADA